MKEMYLESEENRMTKLEKKVNNFEKQVNNFENEIYENEIGRLSFEMAHLVRRVSELEDVIEKYELSTFNADNSKNKVQSRALILLNHLENKMQITTKEAGKILNVKNHSTVHRVMKKVLEIDKTVVVTKTQKGMLVLFKIDEND